MAGKSGLMFELIAGDYRLIVAPERGGSILRFDWRGQPIMRPVCGPSILDVACFPLVPFSNRIANGRFDFNGTQVRLSPNFPGSDHPHPLHGFGWLARWNVVAQGSSSLVMEHSRSAGQWPWAYGAEQILTLDDGGLTMDLSLTNKSAEPMPAGVGFHPYFHRDPQTRLYALHRGEWHSDADCLPYLLDWRERPHDWWDGQPVETRTVDTVYTDRTGPIRIEWPTTQVSATITCSDSLRHTVIYSPARSDFFCAEPVTNETDAFNREGCDYVAPSEQLKARVRLRASRLGYE